MECREKTNIRGESFDVWIRKARLHNTVLSVAEVERLHTAWMNNESYYQYRHVGIKN